MGDYIFYAMIVIAIAIPIFFLFRNVNLWYFRINEQIKILDKANDISQSQIKSMQNQEMLLQLLLQHHLGTEAKISLINKANGNVVYKTVSELLGSTYMNNLHEFHIILSK